jgi:hypothetical protein
MRPVCWLERGSKWKENKWGHSERGYSVSTERRFSGILVGGLNNVTVCVSIMSKFYWDMV